MYYAIGKGFIFVEGLECHDLLYNAVGNREIITVQLFTALTVGGETLTLVISNVCKVYRSLSSV